MSEKETCKINTRREQAEQTRRKLLDMAQALFAENGYSATPVRSINRGIGMADGLLYHYFPGGKKEILSVLVRENFEQIIAVARQRAGTLDELPIEDAMLKIFQNWVEIFLKHEKLLKILMRENSIMRLIEPKRMADIIPGGAKWFPEFLRKRAEKGEIREIDFDCAAELFTPVMFGHLFAVLTGISHPFLGNIAHIKRLIHYQVDLWRPQENECERN